MFAGLAFLGVLLPLLPTTPFLLLAGTCFARSSPELHERILNMPLFGEYLRQWDRSRTVPKAAKRKAWLLIAASFSVSIYLVESSGLSLFLVALACVMLCSVALLPEAELDFIPKADHLDSNRELLLDDVQGLFPRSAEDVPAASLDQREGAEPHIMDQSSDNFSRLSDR